MEKTLEIKVKVNASKTRITKEEDGIIYLDVKSPATEGKANLEIIKFFSKEYKGFVSIIKGFTSKQKTIRIET
tara:strand:+ start:268 stop:486 length:219 start_codon:yes stop_codon:yes gene_type:complete